MITEVISLAYFGNLFRSPEMFEFVLPFLLIFAIVFSIISYVNIFKNNKAVVTIIALAVAFMALQFELVSYFFSDIFPRLGIALSVILVLLIIGGVFLDWENKGMKWFLFIVVAVSIIAVIWGPLRNIGFLNFGFNLFGVDLGQTLFWVIASVLVLWVIFAGTGKVNVGPPPVTNPVK